MIGKEMFYNNTPCLVLAELDNDVVIELLTGVQPYCDEYEEYQEPIYRKIIVPKSTITKSEITRDSIVLERQEMLRISEVEIGKRAKKANQEIRKQREVLMKEIKELKEKITKFDGLESYYHYLNGEIEYVVYSCDCGRYGIKKLSEMMCNYRKSELASVSYRKIRYFDKKEVIEKVKMFVGTYSDDGGTKYEITGFKTIEEAKIQFESLVTEKNINNRMLQECKKWGITNKIITNFESKQKQIEFDKKEKERKELERKLASLDK